MDEERPDPDELLAAIQQEARKSAQGKLKVFLGMAAGVGKTYAMLEAGLKAKSAGQDVVIGYVETHKRKETEALALKLPAIPQQNVEYRGITVAEFDLDAALVRSPQIILVDEMAHTNVPGSRHPKRYQDILELLESGLDVYTTVNVQHIESRAGTVEQITGSRIHETVPDSVLDGAEIEVIDISPDDLIKRLDEGKVYLPDRAAVAMVNFFREGNLTALREMALRLAAERVGHDVRDYMQAMKIEGPWKTGHRLMVAVSPSPLSLQMVRWTKRLADSLNSPWIALYVEGPQPLGEEQQARLSKNLSLARELGAEVITTDDQEVVRGVLRVARQSNVTQIVVGKPAPARLRFLFQGKSMLARLIRESGDIDIHIVRADKSETSAQKPAKPASTKVEWKPYLMALAVVVCVTFANFLLDPLIGNRSVALLYLLAVVLLGLFVGRGPVVLAATVSALSWNYFFLPPRYTFYITSFEDAMMFGMYFVIAIILGQLIARVRSQEKSERQREQRATALYLLTRDLAQASGLAGVLGKVVEQVSHVFQADVAIMLAESSEKLAPQPHSTSTFNPSEKEMSVASWVFNHHQAAGQFTDNLPLSEALYLPLTASSESLGVMGVRFLQKAPPTFDQRNLLEAFARQAALVIDRQRLQEFAEKSRVSAESERLGKTLLDSISHEMRTPISAISSAVSSVRSVSDPGARELLLDEVDFAASRLNRLVGNLLDIARVETGHLKPKMEWHDVGDLINVTLKGLEREVSGHKLSVDLTPRLPLIKMDFVLMEQALNNLIFNAVTHTAKGSEIWVKTSLARADLAISVEDNGAGLPQECLNRLFEKFYRAPGTPAGGSGVGLSIVKGFVEAQGGNVSAHNLPSGGAAFTISIPVFEPPELPEEPK